MKWSAVVLVLCGLLSAGAGAADANDGGDGRQRAQRVGQKLVGQPGPRATLTSIDGQRIDLASFYGKQPVYLKFWATWCIPCNQQAPGFEQIYQQYGKRIAMVAVNTGYSETAADVRAFVAKYQLHIPTVIDDGTLGAQLDLRVTPQHIVIDANGRVVHVGHLDDKELHDALERVAKTPASGDAVALAPQGKAPAAFKVGDKVSGISLTTMAGDKVTLGAGKPRTLVFFSPWCESYLKDSRPAVAAACARTRIETEKQAEGRGQEWLAIASPLWTSRSELSDYAKEKHTAIPQALDQDGAVFRAFGVRNIPTVVKLDAQGRITSIGTQQ
ncbi:TlpA family protein disulfide reductase [Duganella callida]|uniref:TlpA family protein disulfide reductase n=1 Tax=Duganella callida TaxID=2561932 RepID=A0A4Y9S6T8_9BURK|nr:TlpA disulfide reductase family protein [Duganella callida]TFW17166.1 TlpA family protein disulfide reductase [Duganella callida]